MCVTSDMYVSHKLTFLCQGQISRSSTALTRANRLLFSWNCSISQSIFEIKKLDYFPISSSSKWRLQTASLVQPTVQNPKTPLHVQRPEWCSWWSSLENKPSTLGQTPAELNHRHLIRLTLSLMQLPDDSWNLRHSKHWLSSRRRGQRHYQMLQDKQNWRPITVIFTLEFHKTVKKIVSVT